MPVRSVTASAANAANAPNSFLWELASIVNQFIQYHVLGPPNFEISTNFDIQNGDAFNYVNGGTVKTLATDQAFDTGTTKVISADKWSSALLSISAAGTCTVTWAASSYTTEALAIAALPSLPTGHTPLGYATVKTASGETWTAGTDALQGGSGGNPSSDTNYYNIPRYDTITTRELGTP
jgi:hypothetical protein